MHAMAQNAIAKMESDLDHTIRRISVVVSGRKEFR